MNLLNPKMNKKAALELSANFLVIIIIAIILLGAGLMIFFRLKDNSVNLATNLGNQAEEQLNQMMLNPNAKTAIYPNDVELGNGKATVVGLSIKNIYDEQEYFQIKLRNANYFSSPEASAEIVTLDWVSDTNIKIENSCVLIKPKEYLTAGIGLKMNKTFGHGQYVLAFEIKSFNNTSSKCDGEGQNYDVLTVYVTNP